jgi:membrane protein required for colicin V production
LAPIDYIFLFLIFIPFAYGLYRGIVRMVISTLALYLGIMFARQYSHAIADSLEGLLDVGWGGEFLAFILCFVAVLFIFSAIGRLVRKGITGANLGCVDRVLGAVLGVFLGLGLSFGLIFMIFSYLPDPDQYLKKSRLSPRIVGTGTYFLLMIPPWIEEEIQEEYRRLKEFLDKSDREKKGEMVV